MRILLIPLAIMSVVPTSPVLGVDPAAGKQVEQTLKLDQDKSVAYLLYLPNEYESKEGKWPLLLFLHGRGESRGPLSTVKKWGPPRLIERGESFPYVVVSPQCPEAESWDQSRQEVLLLELLDHLAKQFKIDQDRIYLTGLSMGPMAPGGWPPTTPKGSPRSFPFAVEASPRTPTNSKGCPSGSFMARTTQPCRCNGP